VAVFEGVDVSFRPGGGARTACSAYIHDPRFSSPTLEAFETPGTVE
jgi:hypothetical protein